MSSRSCGRQTEFSVNGAVERYRSGEREALADLMHELSRPMAGVARRYLSNQADVEDAVQDAWVSFVRFESTIVHPERLPGWLCVTVGRIALLSLIHI